MKTAWTKDYVVARFNAEGGYGGTWRDLTVPCTLKQATLIARSLKINPRFETQLPQVVTLEEFEKLPTMKKFLKELHEQERNRRDDERPPEPAHT